MVPGPTLQGARTGEVMEQWRLERFSRLIWEAGFVGIATYHRARKFIHTIDPLTSVMRHMALNAEKVQELSGDAPTNHMSQLERIVDEGRHGAERVRKIVRRMKTFSRAEEERRVPLDVHALLELSINMAPG